MKEIQLKQVQLKDWGLLEKIEKSISSQFFAECKNEAHFKKYIKESNVFFITENGKNIGTIAYKEDGDKTFIQGLTVLPAYRKKGFAYKAVTKILDTLGKRKYFLCVHPQNTPALLIYLRLGFIITEWKDNYWGDSEPRLIMQKN